jgi:hypothetical protein
MLPYLSDESPIIKKLIAADKEKKKTEALLSLSLSYHPILIQNVNTKKKTKNLGDIIIIQFLFGSKN